MGTRSSANTNAMSNSIGRNRSGRVNDKYRSNANRGNSKGNVNNYYNYSSVAYDYKTLHNDEEERVPKQHLRKRVAKKTGNTLHRLALVFYVLVLFSAAAMLTAYTANSTSKQAELIAMKDQLKSMKDKNATLRAEIAERTDLEFIEQEATTRLGMSQPQSYQVVDITVPRSSYTVTIPETVQAKTSITEMLAGMINIFSKE